MKTTVVGSYPVPAWLPFARTREALRDAVLAVLKTQELAGIDLVGDGELVRFDPDHPEANGMIDYFLAPLDGVDARPSRSDIEVFRQGEISRYRRQPAAVIRGPLGEGKLDLPRAWELVRDLAVRPLKFTLTGPHMLAKVVLDRHYGEPERVAFELAEILRRQVQSIDAPAVQIDEANIPGAPEEGEWAARAINRVLSGVQGEKLVHVCFGNYGGQTVQPGHWEKLLGFLDALEADALILECARRPREDVRGLAALRRGLGLGLGVIDIKDNAVETPDEVARRIDEFSALVGGPERVRWVHPDCGLWMLPRSVADRKLRSLAEGLALWRGRSA